MTALLAPHAEAAATILGSTLDHRVWLVRHAPTSWTGRRWCGRADPPLSAAGRVVARSLASRLAPELPADALLWTSPSRRARSSARAIADAAGLVETVDPELVEVDVGRVEGLTWGELSTREPALAAAIVRGDAFDWPDGESDASVRQRAGSVAGRLRGAARHRPIVVVSHGAFLHALAGQLSDAEPGVLQAGHVLRLEPLRGAPRGRRR
jgi:probable phosphoglycerate mutase